MPTQFSALAVVCCYIADTLPVIHGSAQAEQFEQLHRSPAPSNMCSTLQVAVGGYFTMKRGNEAAN